MNKPCFLFKGEKIDQAPVRSIIRNIYIYVGYYTISKEFLAFLRRWKKKEI